jgi:hypothetical protein
MKTLFILICMVYTAILPLEAASSTFMDYQNYNHGYCPSCNCYPCRCAELDPAESPCAPCNPPPVAPPNAPKPCVKPDPCNPAPVQACNCGISLWWVGLGIAGLAAAGAIIVSNNNGRRPIP